MAEEFPYPEPPSKQRNDVAIELISGSVGGAAQVLVGQVRRVAQRRIARTTPPDLIHTPMRPCPMPNA